MYEFVSVITWICAIIGFLMGFFDIFGINDSDDVNLVQRIIFGLLVGAFMKGISWMIFGPLLL